MHSIFLWTRFQHFATAAITVTRFMAILPLMAGCGQNLLNNPPGDAGTLVFSLSSDKATHYHRYEIHFHEKDVKSYGIFAWQASDVFGADEFDFQDAVNSGVVFVQKLPPGEYEILYFGLFKQFIMKGTVENIQPPIPFIIEPHKTAYIGNYHASTIIGKTLLGLPMSVGSSFRISNMSERDLAIARQKDPGLEPVRVEIPLLVRDNAF